MNNYSDGYVSYLVGSDCYKNLDEGKANIDSVKGLIKNLYDVIVQASGTIFENIESDLDDIIKDCEYLSKNIDDIMKKLYDNGKMFDTIWENCKREIINGVSEKEYLWEKKNNDGTFVGYKIKKPLKAIPTENGIKVTYCATYYTLNTMTKTYTIDGYHELDSDKLVRFI